MRIRLDVVNCFYLHIEEFRELLLPVGDPVHLEVVGVRVPTDLSYTFNSTIQE